MLNRFIARDGSFERTVVQIVQNNMPSARVGKTIGYDFGESTSYMDTSGGTTVHELLERTGNDNIRKMVWGVSRWGGSHIVV